MSDNKDITMNEQIHHALVTYTKTAYLSGLPSSLHPCPHCCTVLINQLYTSLLLVAYTTACCIYYCMLHILLHVAYTTACCIYYCMLHILLLVAYTTACCIYYCMLHILLLVAYTIACCIYYCLLHILLHVLKKYTCKC